MEIHSACLGEDPLAKQQTGSWCFGYRQMMGKGELLDQEGQSGAHIHEDTLIANTSALSCNPGYLHVYKAKFESHSTDGTMCL